MTWPGSLSLGDPGAGRQHGEEPQLEAGTWPRSRGNGQQLLDLILAIAQGTGQNYQPVSQHLVLTAGATNGP